jgi:hypothetical protein
MRRSGSDSSNHEELHDDMQMDLDLPVLTDPVRANFAVSGYFLQCCITILLMVDTLWAVMCASLLHEAANVQTFTCNSTKNGTYLCEPRGVFYLFAALLSEAIFSSACLMWLKFKFATSFITSFSKHYHIIRYAQIVPCSLILTIATTLCGLVMQSTYTYSTLCMTALLLFPLFGKADLLASLVVSLLGATACLLPFFSVLVSPLGLASIKNEAKALAVVQIAYTLFLALYWGWAKARGWSYKQEFWIFVIVAFLHRWTSRCIAGAFILKTYE